MQVTTSHDEAESLVHYVMTRANTRIRTRVRTVTCPIHRRTFAVSVRGLEIGVLDEACCKDGIERALEHAVEQALRSAPNGQ